MLDDAYKITVDNLFPTNYKFHKPMEFIMVEENEEKNLSGGYQKLTEELNIKNY